MKVVVCERDSVREILRDDSRVYTRRSDFVYFQIFDSASTRRP